MSDRIVWDSEWDVHRIRTGAGVLLGTELGGLPLGYDTRQQAEETIELRAEMADYLLERARLGLRR